MKNKLYITGLVLISVLTYSCSNDEDSYEVKTPQSVLKNELTARPVDSIRVNSSMESVDQEGDPINPIPPRPR
jgi:hypothetical protein